MATIQTNEIFEVTQGTSNSSPLTKLEYKLENHELAKETANKRVASLSRLKINKGNSVSVSSNPVKVSISRGKSQKYGVTTFQKLVKVWEAPREEKNVTQ